MDTDTDVTVEERAGALTDLEPAEPDVPDFFGGDGPSSCDWEDGWCSELADHYILEYCSYPDCKDDHASRYCLRHYVINLGLKLDHLRDCPGMLEARTPDEVRRVAFEHVPGFGAICRDPDGRAVGAASADAAAPASGSDGPQPTDEQIDGEIERLQEQTHFYGGAYDELRMSEATTIDDLRAWLDGLELNHCVWSVWYFSWADDAAMWLQETRYDTSWEKPYSTRHYDPVANEVEWTAYDEASIERRNLIFPKLVTEQDPDSGKLRYWYTCDSLRAKEMLESGQLTDDASQSVPGTFAIVEARTNTVLPVTSGSWIQWKALYDGDQNQLTARDAASFRRLMAPYLDYYDESKPLDRAKAKAKAADIERRLNLAMRDGVKPE